MRSAAIKVRDDATTRLLAQAGLLRSVGKWDEARVVLQRAGRLDPGNARVDGLLAEIDIDRRQQVAIADAMAAEAGGSPEAALRIVAQGLKDNPRHAGLLALQRRLDAALRDAGMRQESLALAGAHPISLDFRDAGLRAVLDAVSRASGVDFVFDKDLRQDTRVTVSLHGASLEDALDLIVGTNRLARKVVDSHTVLIYPDTPEKQRDYQEQVVRLFYLANADAKGASAFLMQTMKLHEPFVDERSNMIALRESAENIRLAERLITVYDRPDPDVVLDLEVLEINTTRLARLGIEFPSSLALTPVAPGSAGSLTLGNVTRLTRDDIALGLGGLSVDLRREAGDYTTLANPEVRVRNREKAHILVGDKIPIVTTTTGTGGFASDSVSYIDVGLKLDVEPIVHSDGGVSMKVGLEVSSLGAATTTSSGTVAYQIGTRDASTQLRLRDGETQLLAGLISRDERRSATRVPGLGDVPVLGRLFSSQLDDGSRSELVLAVTPHIVRNAGRPPASEAEIQVGTEAAPRLRGPGWRSLAEAGASPSNRAMPVPGSVASLPGAVLRSGVLSWVGPSSVRVGETFEARIRLDGAVPLVGLPVEVQFETDSAALVTAEEGDYFKVGGAATRFTKSGDGQHGSLRLGVTCDGEAAAPGQGTVYILRFKATHPGEVWFNIVDAQSRAASPQLAPSLPAALHVVVH